MMVVDEVGRGQIMDHSDLFWRWSYRWIECEVWEEEKYQRCLWLPEQNNVYSLVYILIIWALLIVFKSFIFLLIFIKRNILKSTTSMIDFFFFLYFLGDIILSAFYFRFWSAPVANKNYYIFMSCLWYFLIQSLKSCFVCC